jgi:WD40 repeat protein
MNKKILGIFAVSALLVASLFLLWRCKSDKPDTFNEKDFAELVNLKGSVLQVDTMIMKPAGINVVDNLLFLTNINTEYIFEVYDLNTHKKINECIKHGNGPGEMLYPVIVNLTKDSLWIFDRHLQFLHNYRTKDFISGSNPESVRKIRLDNYSEVTVLPDNRIIASPDMNADRMFAYYDLNAKRLESKGEYPDKNLSAIDHIMSHRFEYTTNLNDRIFVCYTYNNIIEIYDGAGDLVKRRYGPNEVQSKPVVKYRTTKDGISVGSIVPGSMNICYFAPVSVGNEVFVTYVGAPNEKTVSFPRNKKILVFDFEGNPLRIYNLDIPVGYFAVDAEKRIIYGITDMQDLDLPNAQSDYNIIMYKY